MPADSRHTVPQHPVGEATLHIGEVADRTGLSLRTIRHYDETGLLPASGRSQGGFRLYVEADVERLELIKSLKPLGFTLEEMGAIIPLVEGDTLDGPALEEARHYLQVAIAARDKLRDRLAQAERFIHRLEGRLADQA